MYIRTYTYFFLYGRLIILIKQGFKKGLYLKNEALLIQFNKSRFMLIVSQLQKLYQGLPIIK